MLLISNHKKYEFLRRKDISFLVILQVLVCGHFAPCPGPETDITVAGGPGEQSGLSHDG